MVVLSALCGSSQLCFANYVCPKGWKGFNSLTQEYVFLKGLYLNFCESELPQQ